MNTDDFDALYAVLADADNMQHYPYVFDEKRVRGWIERNMQRYQEDGFGLWAVCLKETGEMIGIHFDREYPDEANKITHVSVIHRGVTIK